MLTYGEGGAANRGQNLPTLPQYRFDSCDSVSDSLQQ